MFDPISPLSYRVNDRLAAIHRELRFIARTLARLRHRHHAALVLASSSKPLSSPATLLPDLFQQHCVPICTAMLRRLFASPSQERDEDIESAPASPVCEHPPTLLPSDTGLSPGPRSSSAVPQTSPPGAQRNASKRFSCPPSFRYEYTTVIVDSESLCIFDIPRPFIIQLSRTQASEEVYIRKQRSDESTTPVTGIYLPKASKAAFADFALWTKTGRILQYDHHGVEHYVEHQAHQLVAALALAFHIRSQAYQRAACAELLSLGPSLLWPEDLVNGIFAATAGTKQAVHPARRLIVAIIAAATCGAGKRKVRQGPRVKNVPGEQSERISSGTFWKMYDAYCAEHGPEIAYPETLASIGF